MQQQNFQLQELFSQEKLEDKESRQTLLQTINNLEIKQIFQDFYPYGRVFFNSKILIKHNQKLLTSQKISLLQQPRIFILPQSKQQTQQWHQIFSLILQIVITKFDYNGDKYKNPKILKSIQSIGFYRLTDISLYACGIQNIEGLGWLDAPMLEKLNLIYNRVGSYKCLTKAKFQKLTHLYLYDKSQKQYTGQKASSAVQSSPNIQLSSSISRCNFDLHIIRLEKYSYNSTIQQDLSTIMAKLKQNKIKYPLHLYLNLQKRIIKENMFKRIVKGGKVVVHKFNQVQNYYNGEMDTYQDQLEFQ